MTISSSPAINAELNAPDDSPWLDALEVLDPKSFLRGFWSKSTRPDGRLFSTCRRTNLMRGVLTKSTAGSSLVRLGQTQVLAGITLQVGQPSVPNQGDVVVTDDKVLQSILLDSVDLTCLSIIDGKCAWRLVVTIQVLQGDGNLWDARLLAAVAALTDVRLPKTQLGKAGLIEVIPKSEGTAIQFDYLPAPLTIGIHHDDTSTNLFADPTLQEEEFLQGHLTMVVNEENDIVHLVHAGGSLQRQDLAVCAHMAYGRGKEIRGLLSE